MQNYKIDVLTLNSQQEVRSDCADITFFNSGLSVITLNNALTLPAGSSISFTANNNEIDKTIYRISFGTGYKSCTIFRKIYVK